MNEADADSATDPNAAVVADQSEVVDFLADPASYDGAADPVKRIDTHGAMVFLAGERAYKIKRAVKFPYMDFSTLERRRAVCEREVDLNRRTAPELYLDTVPIVRRSAGGLALGGDGEVVEWAVVMKRFDQSGLFDRLARDGRLTSDLMDALTDEIVRFHDAAERLEAAAAGEGAGLRPVVDESLEELEARSDLFPADAVARVADALRRRLEANAALLEDRRRRGFVRHCHGDLHLRNVALIDGRPTLFDCIEFDDALASIDVHYDLAFLLMDLDHRCMRPLANRVLNRYLAKTDALSALAAMPLFLALRALVRAKVGASAAAGRADADARERSRHEARAYFEAAQGYLDTPEPRLIAVGGLSGTGKTTLARRLAPALGPAPGAVHLRSDVIRKELCGVDADTRLPEAAYDAETGRRVYAAIVERARTALAAGHAVVADAVYARADERADIAAVARALEVPFEGLWLEAGTGTLEARVAARTGDASDATPAVVRRQRDYDTGAIDWRRIDAGGSPEDVAAAAARVLGVDAPESAG